MIRSGNVTAAGRGTRPFVRQGVAARWILPGTLIILFCGEVDVALANDVPAAVLQAERERIAAISRATKAAVAVFGPTGQGGGSGVVVTPDGYALTNYHVAKPSGDYMKCGMQDGNLYDAVIVGVDPTGDVALIKLLGRDDFPTATIADSDAVRVGDWCFAVGNPFLLATDFHPTVTYGIVSGVHRYQYPAGTLLEYTDCIQTDASINPGNSGGPLFNANGELIGVNGRGSFEKRGRVNVGVGYAISMNQIKKFMGYLRSGRIVDHATLGATVSTNDDGRVVVTNILNSSDAARRGLRYGDEIVSLGGRSIDTVNEFKNVLGIFPKGWRIPLTYRRENKLHEVVVRLAGVHGIDELVAKTSGQAPEVPNPEPGPRRPKPGDPEQPDREQPRPDRDPSRRLKTAVKPKIPANVARLIKPRIGYANYYFNELNRDRVWNAMSDLGSFRGAKGPWVLEGSVPDQGEVQIVLTDQQVVARFPEGEALLDGTVDLDRQLEPIGSGGLLAALHLWRRLLMVGPREFGELYYLGTAPIPGHETLFDVLVGIHDVIDVRFIVAPDSGRLAAVEMFPDSNVDPCEVYFDDYREVDGRWLPFRMEVRFGDKTYADIQFEKISLSTATEEEA